MVFAVAENLAELEQGIARANCQRRIRVELEADDSELFFWIQFQFAVFVFPDGETVDNSQRKIAAWGG